MANNIGDAMSGEDVPSVMCVHAHPDDEALFTGGILARSAAAGGRTAVVTCTWQEGDERIEELRKSLAILGAGEPRLLGYTDNAFADGVRFCDAPFDEAVGALVAHIRDFRPDILVTYDAFGSYGHPDHIHAHRITLAAFEAAGYDQLYPGTGSPWSPQHLCLATFPRTAIESKWKTLFGASAPDPGPGVPGVPDALVDLAIDVSPWFEDKWSAFSAHETEIVRGGGATQFAILSDVDRREMLGTEWFVHRTADNGRGSGKDPFLPDPR
nr:PIG-L family deacetylase [Rhodococcus sp. (in: high G+C Gram-positive bacteria)]